MIIKSSRVNNKKNMVSKINDTIFMNTGFLDCYNEKNKKYITPHIKTIVISKKLIEEDTDYIEIFNSSATNLYFESFANFGDITIPYDYFREENLYVDIVNEGNVSCQFKKINIVNNNKRLFTLNLEDNIEEINIKQSNEDGYDLCIYLRTNKKIIYYYVDKNNGCYKSLYRYFISKKDLDKNGNLDIRNISDYETIHCEKIDINTLIVDKGIFNDLSLNQLVENNANTPNIKYIRFIDDNDMKLIPFDKTFLIKEILLCENNYKYLYIKTNDDEVIIYIDKNNKLNYISKKELLKDNNIENIYFRFRKQTRVAVSTLNPLNLIIKEYKNGIIKIFDLNNEFIIDENFKKNILLNKEKLKINIEFLNYINNNDWLGLLKSKDFNNNLFYKISHIHTENERIKEKSKRMGLSEDALNYLRSRGILENIINRDLIEYEIDGFNEIGECFKKVLKK